MQRTRTNPPRHAQGRTGRTRPRVVLVGALGAGAMALAGCGEEAVDASVFASPDACIGAGVDPAACEASFAEARAEHLETAPRYDAQAVCEAQHGEGACVAEERTGGSVFLPLMAGYLVGSALSGGARARALVPSAGQGFRTTDGRVGASALSGRTNVGAAAFNARPPSTRTAPALTQSSVARTGGFGAARTSGGLTGSGG